VIGTRQVALAAIAAGLLLQACSTGDGTSVGAPASNAHALVAASVDTSFRSCALASTTYEDRARYESPIDGLRVVVPYLFARYPDIPETVPSITDRNARTPWRVSEEGDAPHAADRNTTFSLVDDDAAVVSFAFVPLSDGRWRYASQSRCQQLPAALHLVLRDADASG